MELGTAKRRGEVTKVTNESDVQPSMGWIWIRGPLEAIAALRSMLAEGIPVRWKDFSQSEVEGPRMLPSM
jgi:hypothetical protein